MKRLFLSIKLLFIFTVIGCSPKDIYIHPEVADSVRIDLLIPTDSLLALADRAKLKYSKDKREFILNLDSLNTTLSKDKTLQRVFIQQIHDITSQYEKQKTINKKLTKPKYKKKDSIIYNYIYKDSVIYICDTVRQIDTVYSIWDLRKLKKKKGLN